MSHVPVHVDPRAASWGAIFAGTITALAITFALSMLGASMGIAQVDAQSANPLDGVAGTFGISSVVTMVISLAAGGFVAGRLAGVAGFTHGFLAWAVCLAITVLIGSMAISTAARTSAAAVGAVASGAGSVVGAVGSAAGSSASAIAGAINEDLIDDFDMDQTRNDLREALRNTDIEALQPRRLEPVIADARRDITAAARELAFNPGDFSRIVEELGTKLKERADGIAGDIDRDDVVTALTNNGMTRAEAERAADRAIETYDNARDAIVNRVNSANELIESGKQHLADLEQEARQQADAAAAAASKAAFWGFITALVGALVASFAGMFGARSRERYHFA